MVSSSDIVVNVLLFLPFGIALRRFSRLRVVLVASIVSLSIEAAQLLLARSPNSVDVVTNVLGAWIGAWLASPRDVTIPPITSRFWIPAAFVAMGVTLTLRTAVPDDSFSNWEPYPLVLGDEPTDDRPWHGVVRDVEIYDRALPGPLESEPSQQLLRNWPAGGPILALNLSSPARLRLDGPNGPQELDPPLDDDPSRATPEGLVLSGRRVDLPAAAADHLLHMLQDGRELTLVVRFRPADLEQNGPARIVSFSRDPFYRNLTLGQENSQLVLRIRTPATGLNGTAPVVATTDVLTTGWQTVRAVYDHGVCTIFLNDRCVLENPVMLHDAPPGLGWVLGATIVLCVSSAALAGASLGIRTGGRRTTMASLVGTGAWGILWWAGTWSHVPHFTAPAAALGAASILATLPLISGAGTPTSTIEES